MRTYQARARRALFVLLAAIVTLLASPHDAQAATGSFKLQKKEFSEVSGGWRLFVTIELPKAPLTAHQTMRFIFTKTVVYERSLLDNQPEPVMTRQTVENQSPSVESLDVNFSDASGKIYKGTRFDFVLTRPRGYEAGEYKIELRTSDGVTIGSPATVILKGDNPPVDRRTMAFNAKDKSIKKVEAYDAGLQAKNDDPPPPSNDNIGSGEVTPMGTATGFVPPEGLEETDEEKIKTRPRGCGCEVLGLPTSGAASLVTLPIVATFLAALRRRASRRRGA